MTPKCIKKYFKSCYGFGKATGMSPSSYMNWQENGFIPFLSQKKIEKITGGKLKAKWVDPEDFKKG